MKEDEDWVIIMTSTDAYKVNVAQHKLEQSGIESVVINKQDSAYIPIGEVILYVPNQKKIIAEKVLQQSLN